MKNIIFAGAMSLASIASFAQSAAGLRCEYLVNPLGIDCRAPRLTWQMNDPRHGAVQKAYRITVGEDSAAVAAGRGDVWDTRTVASSDMLVVYSGQQLKPFTKYYWSVTLWDRNNKASTPTVASFETGMMDIRNWRGYWISDGQHLNGYSPEERRAPYFRKTFTVERKIKSARAYIAVGGLYELYLNGEKVGNHRLDPMYTRFDRRNLYVTYDVTRQLQEGKNAVGVLLGNGWYNMQSYAVWYFDRAPWRDRPTFCFDLRITYDDGTSETISSDRDWKTTLSPIVFNSIYTAEHHDCRLAIPNWNTADFDDSSWTTNVVYRQAPSQNIVSQQLHPIRNVERIPVKVFKKKSDRRYIFDLGRNIAGVSQLRIKGKAGTEVRIKHSEILRPNDSLYMQNIEEHYRPRDDSDPFQTDILILSGKGEDEFMPYFNYKGFQYVEVTADNPIDLTQNSLVGWFMHSDVPPVGQVQTSSQLINKLWFAANNSYLSNFFGYPTDCPHREKNGWTGDGKYAVDLGLYNFDGITVYEKWLADHQDAQEPNGLLPNIIPCNGWGLDWATGPDWTGSVAIVPWALYEFYGDNRMLYALYDNIKRYVDRLERLSPTGLCNLGLGDWIPVKSQTPQKYTTTVYYYRVVGILTNIARMRGQSKDFEKYSALAEKIKTAFNREYYHPESGIYGQGYQTELSTALHYDLVPDSLRARVADRLAARVKADNSHLDVGLLGSKAIFYALSDNGYADLAFTVLAQDTYPSFGYWIAHDNATTLYEAWRAIGEAPEASLNHIMFGEYSAWLYKAIGGINSDPDQPGFKNILLRPNFVEGLTFANISYDSPRGKIVSSWERKKKTVTYRFTIPANTTANLTLPAGYVLRKTELADGTEIAMAEVSGSYKLAAGSYVMTTERK